MSKKNILLLINQLHTGGAEKVVANLSVDLSLHYNVFIAIFNDVNNITYNYGGTLIKCAPPFADAPHQNSTVKRITRLVSLVRQVRREKKKNKIDVCISFLEASNMINLFSKSGEKTIVSVRSYLSHEFNDLGRLKILKPLIKLIYNRAYKVVVPSKLIGQDLVKNFGLNAQKATVIYNYNDQEHIRKLAEESIPLHLKPIFSHSRVLINVGRMNNPKAQWRLIPVIEGLKKKYTDLKLVILGDGPLKQRIIDEAKAAGLRVYLEGRSGVDGITEHDIYLLGHQTNPFPYFCASTIFIKSSLYEGFPNVIIEAMSCGLPIISSDCESGPAEILDPLVNRVSPTAVIRFGEYGILLPVDEHYPAAAISAIDELLTDPEKADHYRKVSRERARSFDKTILVKEWMSIIEA